MKRTAYDHPLLALPKFGDGLGLHRVATLMTTLGVSAEWLGRRAIAVTGSNGKGSVARIASNLMGETGAHVGLFTSPHLYRFNERFQIDDKPVTDGVLAAAMDKVLAAVNAYQAARPDRVGAFEAQFLTAAVLFESCAWVVLEAGIGGRYDPVRLAHAPVNALVSLDLEHTDLLGKTLVEIAFDKLDATAPGGVAILGESARPLRSEIETYAELRGIEVRFISEGDWVDRGVENGRQRFDVLGLTGLSSSLVGRHQLNNHAVALAACRERLRRSHRAAPSGQAWREAIALVTWPGRLERIDPRLVIDVGHTPEGVKAALEGYRRLEGGPALLVTGVSANKDASGVMRVLAPGFDRVLVTAAHHNGKAADETARLVREFNLSAEITVAPDIASAAQIAQAQDRPVYAAGGLFLAAEFAAAWRGEDPKALRFF